MLMSIEAARRQKFWGAGELIYVSIVQVDVMPILRGLIMNFLIAMES